MLLLRQLFDVAGGGPETDAFKHLAAAFTVLRSLGSAKTQANSESSRIVILFSLHFFQPHNNGATFSFSPSIPFSLNSRDSYLVFIIYYYGIWYWFISSTLNQSFISIERINEFIIRLLVIDARNSITTDLFKLSSSIQTQAIIKNECTDRTQWSLHVLYFFIKLVTNFIPADNHHYSWKDDNCIHFFNGGTLWASKWIEPYFLFQYCCHSLSAIVLIELMWWH